MSKSSDTRFQSSHIRRRTQAYQLLCACPIDGDVANWEGFKTAFRSTAGESLLQPMMQLKVRLTGVAAAAIDGLPLDRGRYKMALELLGKRFTNKPSHRGSHSASSGPR